MGDRLQDARAAWYDEEEFQEFEQEREKDNSRAGERSPIDRMHGNVNTLRDPATGRYAAISSAGAARSELARLRADVIQDKRWGRIPDPVAYADREARIRRLEHLETVRAEEERGWAAMRRDKQPSADEIERRDILRAEIAGRRIRQEDTLRSAREQLQVITLAMDGQDTRLVTMAQLAAALGIDRVTFWRWRRSGRVAEPGITTRTRSRDGLQWLYLEDEAAAILEQVLCRREFPRRDRDPDVQARSVRKSWIRTGKLIFWGETKASTP